MFKKILVLVALAVLLLSTNVVALEDVPGHQHEEAISKLVSLGIIEGKGDNRFHPEATLTRAEAAKVAVMMRGFSAEDIAEISDVQVFNDVHEGMPAHAWAIPWINKAFDLGLIEGVGAGYFNPGGTLQMNEWATILLRLTRNTTPGMSWPADYDSRTKSLGIAEGIAYSGPEKITRAQMTRLSTNTLSKPIYLGDTLINSSFGLVDLVIHEAVPQATIAGVYVKEVELVERGRFTDLRIVLNKNPGSFVHQGDFIIQRVIDGNVDETFVNRMGSVISEGAVITFPYFSTAVATDREQIVKFKVAYADTAFVETNEVVVKARQRQMKAVDIEEVIVRAFDDFHMDIAVTLTEIPVGGSPTIGSLRIQKRVNGVLDKKWSEVGAFTEWHPTTRTMRIFGARFPSDIRPGDYVVFSFTYGNRPTYTAAPIGLEDLIR